MRVALIVGLLALAACSPVKSTSAASADPPASESASESLTPEAVLLPQAFTGRWDASLEACKASSDMKLVVTQTELTFWESSGQISSVTINGPDDVTVKAAFSGEGEQWDRDMHLVLTNNGQTLKVDDTARVRCP